MAKGGSRPGAGRPRGARDKVTREAGATIGELARQYGEQALKTLADIAVNGDSESARVAAANALLDRGYGKPPQSIEHSGPNGGPIRVTDLTDEQLAAIAAGGSA